MTAATRRLLRFAAGMLLALLLGDSLSPSALRADCGEHVRFSKPQRHERQPIGLESAPANEPIRCTGPECSNQEEPPLAPVAPSREDADSWGCLAAAPTVPLGSPGSRVRHGAFPPLPRNASRIFHPPRS
jgi:hypothetical protein